MLGLFAQGVGVLFVLFSFFVCQNVLSTFVLSISPQLATRLLAHKIQSPQEWEAMQALTVSNHHQNFKEAHDATNPPRLLVIKSFQGFGDMREERWKAILQ